MFNELSCRLGFNVLRWMSALWYGSCTFRLDLVICCVVLVLCFLYAVPCGGSSIELTTSGSGPVGPGSEGRHRGRLLAAPLVWGGLLNLLPFDDRSLSPRFLRFSSVCLKYRH